MSEIFVYTIHYTKSETLDTGFLTLDNSSNPRPDWFEYWPIRNFLRSEALDENAFYGFLSPKFRQKTNLSSAAVYEIAKANSGADIVLMTPSLHLTAYYWNVFHYGEACHPGLLDLATRFFKRIGEPTNLIDLVTNSRNEIYSNYMLAKPRFWRAWLAITERLVAIAESPTDPLGAELRNPTRYRGKTDVQMKIFVLERVPTWLLTRNADFVAAVRDPFVVRSRLYKVPGAIICDALKVAYAATGERGQYKDMFRYMSRFGRIFSLQMRLGNFLGFKAIRANLAALGSYWTSAGKS
jgi:hypothetical protein